MRKKTLKLSGKELETISLALIAMEVELEDRLEYPKTLASEKPKFRRQLSYINTTLQKVFMGE